MNSRNSKANRGSALVEFALAFSLLGPLLICTFKFGYGFYQYNKLETAVRSAARYGALRSYDSNNSTPSTSYNNAVKNVALYGDPTGGSATVVPSITAENLTVTITFVNDVPATVKVAIKNYNLSSITGKWLLIDKPFAVFRYTGRFAP